MLFSCLTDGVDQFAQAGDLPAGSCAVNNTLGRCLVNVGDSEFQGLNGCFLVAFGNGGADILDEGAHGAADMVVAGITLGVLQIPLES